MAAKAGLSSFSEFKVPEGLQTSSLYASPYPELPTEVPDVAAYASSLDTLVKQSMAPSPETIQEPKRGPGRVYRNQNTNQYFVNGLIFDIDDYSSAVVSEEYLNTQEMRRPEGTGWEEMNRDAFQKYINKLKDPSIGTVYKKNVGIGVDVVQELGGSALQLIGKTTGINWAEAAGKKISEQQTIDIAKKQVFRHEFTDIKHGAPAIDWFVGVAGQQTPIIAEILATFAVGYMAGGANPFSGTVVGGALVAAKTVGGRLLLKKTLQKEFTAAIKAAGLAQRSGKGFKSLSPLHQKRIRQATGMTAVIANNYAFGLGDIYGELKDIPGSHAVIKSWLGAIPYAIAESLPEMLLAGKFLGGIRGKGGTLKRLASGMTVGGIAEGGTELAQELIILLSNPEVDLTTEEGINRMKNAFAAGAAIGVPIGGGVNVLTGTDGGTTTSTTGGEEVDLINRRDNYDEQVKQVDSIDQRIIEIEKELELVVAAAREEWHGGTPVDNERVADLQAEIDSLMSQRENIEKDINVPDEVIRAQIDAQLNPEEIAEEVLEETPLEETPVEEAPVEEAPVEEELSEEELELQREAEKRAAQRQADKDADARIEREEIVKEQIARRNAALEQISKNKLEEQVEAVRQNEAQRAQAAEVEKGQRKVDELKRQVDELKGAAETDTLNKELKKAQEALDKSQKKDKEKADKEAEATKKLNAEEKKIALLLYKAILKRLEPHISKEAFKAIPAFAKLNAAAQRAFLNRAPALSKMKDAGGQVDAIHKLVEEIIAINEQVEATEEVVDEAVDKLSPAEKAKRTKKIKALEEELDKAKQSLEAKIEALDKSKAGSNKLREQIIASAVKEYEAIRQKIEKEIVELGGTIAPLFRESLSDLKAMVAELKEKAAVMEVEIGPAPKKSKPLKQVLLEVDTKQPTKKSEEGYKALTPEERLKKLKKKPKKAEKAEKKPTEAEVKKAKAAAKKKADAEAAAAEAQNAAEAAQADAEREAEDKSQQEAEIAAEAKRQSEIDKNTRTPEQAETYWNDKVRPDWATKIGIRFSDLPTAIQKLLTTPQEGTGKTMGVDGIIAELKQDPYWIAIEDALTPSVNKTQGDMFIEYLFKTAGRKNKLISRIFEHFIEAHHAKMSINNAEFAFSPIDHKVILDKIISRIRENKTWVRTETTKGPTAKGILINALDLKDVLEQDGVEVRDNKWVPPVIPKTKKKVLEKDEQGEDNSSVSPAASIIRRLESYISGISNLSSTNQTDELTTLEADFENLSKEDREQLVNQRPIKDYFTKEGKLKLRQWRNQKIFKPTANLEKGTYYWVGMPTEAKAAVKKAINEKEITEEDRLREEQLLLLNAVKDGQLNETEHKEAILRLAELRDEFAAIAKEAEERGAPAKKATDPLKIFQAAKKKVEAAKEKVKKANAKLAEVEALKSFAKDKDKKLARAKKELAKVENELTDAKNAVLKAEREYVDFSMEGMAKRAVGKVDTPMGIQKIKLLTKTFMKKIKVAPRIHVYRDVAHLKADNKKLFDKAAATKLPGEFETSAMMGFAMSNDIILFSEYILDGRQLRHTLAHEIIGHHGLRAILSKAERKTVLMNIYENDSHMQLMADRNADLYDISLEDAIEEALADKAAAADISTIVRVWNAIKHVLNKLGVELGDESSRYWVHQLRLYARTGTSSFANPQQILQNVKLAEAGEAWGMYSKVNDHATSVSDYFRNYQLAGGVENFFGGRDYWTAILKSPSFKKYAKEEGGWKKFIGRTLEEVQTLNHIANKSVGLTDIYHIFQAVAEKSKFIMGALERMLPTRHLDSTSKEQKKHAFEMLAEIAMFRGLNAEQMLKKFKKRNIVSMNPDTGRHEINEVELQKLINEAHVSLQQLKDGLKIVFKGDPDLKIEDETRQIFGSEGSGTEWVHDITKDSAEWKMVIEHQKAIAYAAAEVLLGETKGGFNERKLAFRDFNKIEGIENEDVEFFTRLYNDYISIIYEGGWDVVYPENDAEHKIQQDIFEESYKKAEEFLKASIRGIYTKEKINDLEEALQGRGENAELMGNRKYSYIVENIKRLNEKKINKATTFEIQNVMQNMWLNEAIVVNQKVGALRTILGNYVPLVRDGRYQIMVKAYRIDSKGNLGLPVKLNSHTKATLLYTQTDSLTAAQSIAETFNKGYKSADNSLDFRFKDKHGKEHNVRLVAEYSESRTEAPSTGPVGFNDLISTLTGARIQFNPTQRKLLTKLNSGFRSKARTSLPRKMTPGFETRNGLKHVAAYLETQAHVAAKSEHRHMIARTMNDKNKWLGDDKELNDKAQAVERLYKQSLKMPHSDRLKLAVRIARDDFVRYAYMYGNSKAVGKEGTERKMTVGGQEHIIKIKGRGERYRDKATGIVAWYDQSTDVVTSTEDILSGKISAKLKMITVLGQLGGNVATALVNLTSIPMHTAPYLAYYNETRGVGGGFGLGKSTAAISSAMGNLKNKRFGTEEFLADMVKNWRKDKQGNPDRKFVNKNGLAYDEALFLLDETRLGILSPAQFNALAGSARGGIEKARTIKGVQLWMLPFTYTEQLNRRTTALATYRLHRDRLIAAGERDQRKIKEISTREANKAVDETQGNYDMYNRPQIARGNIFQYPFMYKQFVLTSVQLLWAMPLQGKLVYLGLMLAVAGLKGFPFADDLLDVVDTLAQKFDIKMGSIELTMLKTFDDIAPGWGHLIMNGWLDKFSGATVSTRLGHGDLIPLTGAYRAGANYEREAKNLFGPVYAMITGLATTGSSTVRWGMEGLGILPDTTRLNDIGRESSIAALRAISDAWAYTRDGTITNAQGKVVSRDLTNWTIVLRALGFYPSKASEENRIVRIGKRASDYAADIRRTYQVGYVKARISKNQSWANSVLKQVEYWNRTAYGTEFYIPNFRANAEKAVREALRPSAERYLKSAPVSSRGNIEWLMELYGLD